MSATNAKFARSDYPPVHRLPAAAPLSSCGPLIAVPIPCAKWCSTYPFPLPGQVPIHFHILFVSRVFELTRFVIQINVKISISFCYSSLGRRRANRHSPLWYDARARQQCGREHFDRKEIPNGFFMPYFTSLVHRLNFTN